MAGFDISALCARIHDIPHISASDCVKVLEALGAKVQRDDFCNSDAEAIVDALDECAGVLEELSAVDVRELSADEVRHFFKEYAGDFGGAS